MAKRKTGRKEIQEELPVWEEFPNHKDICTRIGVKHNDEMNRIIEHFGFKSRRELIEAWIRATSVHIENKSDQVLGIKNQLNLLKDYREKKE